MNILRSRHLAQKHWLSRRTFLTAVGLGISAPAALKMSRMAIAQETGRPSRLLIYFVPHGVPIEHYEPSSGMDFNVGEGVLAPLSPYKNYLTYMRGASNIVQDNHDAIRSTLTGSDDQDDSIDYLIAQQLGVQAHVLGVQAYRSGSGGPDHDSKLCRQGGYVTPVLNPADALDDLFVGLDSSEGVNEPVAGDTVFRQEALALTEGEVEAMRTGLSELTSERTKLQIHLESIQALKASSSGEGAVISCQQRPSLPAVEALKGQDPFAISNFGTILDGHLEAVANAFVCGSARIATIQCMHANAQIPMDFPGGPGIGGNHHDPLSHSSDAAGRTSFAIVQRWFYQRLADKCLAILDQPDPEDPANTVLANTTILTCTEIIDGQMHNSNAKEIWLDGANRYTYLPWNIIGGGSGLFPGGKIATMDGVDHRNVLAAVAESMGVTLPKIGGLNVSTPAELLA
jgi:hypothetical protein